MFFDRKEKPHTVSWTIDIDFWQNKHLSDIAININDCFWTFVFMQVNLKIYWFSRNISLVSIYAFTHYDKYSLRSILKLRNILNKSLNKPHESFEQLFHTKTKVFFRFGKKIILLLWKQINLKCISFLLLIHRCDNETIVMKTFCWAWIVWDLMFKPLLVCVEYGFEL